MLDFLKINEKTASVQDLLEAANKVHLLDSISIYKAVLTVLKKLLMKVSSKIIILVLRTEIYKHKLDKTSSAWPPKSAHYSRGSVPIRLLLETNGISCLLLF